MESDNWCYVTRSYIVEHMAAHTEICCAYCAGVIIIIVMVVVVVAGAMLLP